MRKLIYIASPYTIGDTEANVNRQIDTYAELIKLGFAPIAPLLSHFVEIKYPQDHSTWIDIDFAMLSKCDGLLRLDGESKGADLEVGFATDHDIPVYYSISELKS